MEEWLNISGYEGLYQVSNLGKVRSFKSGKWQTLKNRLTPRGYYIVTLYKDGKATSKWVHRLVAQAFIPNPENLPQINHEDEDKLNNAASNLEWCDSKYNNNYGTKKERLKKSLKGKAGRPRKSGKPVHCIDTGETYESASEAERQTGIRHIDEVCSGKRQSAGGFWWEYV